MADVTETFDQWMRRARECTSLRSVGAKPDGLATRSAPYSPESTVNPTVAELGADPRQSPA